MTVNRTEEDQARDLVLEEIDLGAGGLTMALIERQNGRQEFWVLDRDNGGDTWGCSCRICAPFEQLGPQVLVPRKGLGRRGGGAS